LEGTLDEKENQHLFFIVLFNYFAFNGFSGCQTKNGLSTKNPES
jgi:hypothetical protein